MAAVNDENNPHVANRRRAPGTAGKTAPPVSALEAATKEDNGAGALVKDVSSVKVVLRVRPTAASDLRLGYTAEPIECTDASVHVLAGGGTRAFHFDHVHAGDCSQPEVFESIKENIEGFLEGYNSTVFAYGQTGSGKTYTMGTSPETLHSETTMGILPRFLDFVFDHVKTACLEWNMHLSFVELHNEELRDLLDDRAADGVRKEITLRESAKGAVVIQATPLGNALEGKLELDGVLLALAPRLATSTAAACDAPSKPILGPLENSEGLTEEKVASRAEVLTALERGCAVRATAATNMNLHSSRSHALATITLHQLLGDADDANAAERRRITSKFCFVDLAGSERLKRTQAEGARFKEGVSINQGLLGLGKVISALADKEKGHGGAHVPYRDSKLTRLLRDSLGGNSRTVMIACVSPSDADLEETLSTLRYAARASQIKNRPVQNVTQDDAAAQIAMLQGQVAMLQQQISRQNGSAAGAGLMSPFSHSPSLRGGGSFPHTPIGPVVLSDDEPNDSDGATSDEDGELAWMNMLVESSEAALLESQMEGEGSPASGEGQLQWEAARLDAAISTREAALAQLQRARRRLHDAVMRNNQMESRVRLLEAEISSVESENKRVEAQLRSTNANSDADRAKTRSRYEERIKELRQQLGDMKNQQAAAARLQNMHARASKRLEAMQEEILRQKQQRIALQRALREEHKEKRRAHTEHSKEVSKLAKAASSDARQVAKLKDGLQVREAALRRKQEEIQRLKALRRADVTAIAKQTDATTDAACSQTEAGATWLHECVHECAKEASALAAAERAIDRRAEALAALTEVAGGVRRGSGITNRFSMLPGEKTASEGGEGEAQRAELEAEAAYAAALVEEAQANVARYSGSMDRLTSRIASLRLVPARSLCVALAAEARDSAVAMHRAQEEAAALRAALHAKHGSGGEQGASNPDTGEFFHAVAMMELDYEERISSLMEEVNTLQAQALAAADNTDGPALPRTVPSADAASAIMLGSDAESTEALCRMRRHVEMKEEQVTSLQRQLAATQRQLADAEAQVTALQCQEGSEDEEAEVAAEAGTPVALNALPTRRRRGGARYTTPQKSAPSPLAAARVAEAEEFDPRGEAPLELVGVEVQGDTYHAARTSEEWTRGGSALDTRQAAAYAELMALASEVGLTEAEVGSAASTAEGQVAAAWAVVLTSARARRDVLLVQEVRLEAACTRLARALGAPAPDFAGARSAEDTLRARLTAKVDLREQLKADSAAQCALLEELRATLRERAAALGGSDPEKYLALWQAAHQGAHVDSYAGSPTAEPTLNEAIDAAKAQLADADAAVEARTREVGDMAVAIGEWLRALSGNNKATGPLPSCVPKQHAAAAKMVREGRGGELGMADGVQRQMADLMAVLQHAGAAVHARLHAAQCELEDLEACLAGQPSATAAAAAAATAAVPTVTPDMVPSEADISAVTAKVAAATTQLEGRCHEVLKELAALWEELGVTLQQQEEFEDTFAGIGILDRLRALNAEHAKQAARAAKLRPVLAMVHEREELRLKMIEFEKSASDKSRLYARGTKLLEEEKFRKHVKVYYPKLMAKLQKAIAEWEEAEEATFEWHGVDYKTTLNSEDPQAQMELLHLRVAKVTDDAEPAATHEASDAQAPPAAAAGPKSARPASARAAATSKDATTTKAALARPRSAVPRAATTGAAATRARKEGAAAPKAAFK